jgi:hypothetical protein
MTAWEYGYLRTGSKMVSDTWEWSAHWIGPNADLAEYDVTDGLVVNVVNELGADGWELATVEWSEGVTPRGEPWYTRIYHLKRPVQG